ncbi:hypothetical protein CMV30_14890 [Nibricoccus aquaticus]|uniref:Uncharacterized protein n=1 Tax=Nibricoccus aquaticus TaxID=2576891 RepID=A0A290QFT2_9BACT|nr:hypothetical protein [Nibricoccus aquaticus]ATC65136.1 hypothetical protein CMV30_14890 [Nibricoccus aquaticus]
MIPFDTIGRCTLLCQFSEYVLGALVLLERKKHVGGVRDLVDFLDSFAKTRTQVLESLQNELKQDGISYLDELQLDQLIEKRNVLVHRLPHEPWFIAGMQRSHFTMEDELRFFLDALSRIEEVFSRRARELGIVLSRTPVSSGEQLVNFASELKKRADQIHRDRKKK